MCKWYRQRLSQIYIYRGYTLTKRLHTVTVTSIVLFFIVNTFVYADYFWVQSRGIFNNVRTLHTVTCLIPWHFIYRDICDYRTVLFKEKKHKYDYTVSVFVFHYRRRALKARPIASLRVHPHTYSFPSPSFGSEPVCNWFRSILSLTSSGLSLCQISVNCT